MKTSLKIKTPVKTSHPQCIPFPSETDIIDHARLREAAIQTARMFRAFSRVTRNAFTIKFPVL